jgi:hypothetical protein
MPQAFVIGDLHGQYEKVVALLRQAALIDQELNWCGADAILCFLGDYCDRGPDGIGCIDLVMRLQQEAAVTGGQVIALLGNHEPLLLAAHRFGDQRLPGQYESFWSSWKRNGGVDRDLAGLTPERLAWLCALPAMTLLGRHLLMHADALFYTDFGHSITTVNATITAVLTSDDPAVWEQLLFVFTERMAFWGDPALGVTYAANLLKTFGGEQLIHGHTPISYLVGQSAGLIHEPLIYANGLCVNVDGGMYLGGRGFVYAIDRETGR